MSLENKRVCIDCAVAAVLPIKGKTDVGSMKCQWCGELAKNGEIYLATDKVEVKLTYFKQNGKYYSSGSFMVDAVGRGLWEIFDLVQEKVVAKKLPGLIEGHSEFIVLVNVPWHPHDHPCLINTESVLEWLEERKRAKRTAQPLGYGSNLR